MTPPPVNILLVEDNPADARLLQALLAEVTSTGFRWVRADRLSVALESLRREPIDIVLLDLSLPDSHGLATFTRLRAEALALPIVVVTGLDDQGLALEAMQAGAQDYLVKGKIDGTLLERALRYAIGRNRAEVALVQTTGLLSRAEAIGNTGSWEWEALGSRAVWSDGLYDILGHTRQTLAPSYPAYLASLHPDDRERVQQTLETAFQQQVAVEFESRILRPDGQLRVLSTRAEITLDHHGQAVRQAGIEIDITERKQRERELEAIGSLSAALRTAETQAQMLPIILEQVMTLVLASGVSLGLRAEETDEIVITLAAGEVADLTGIRLPAVTGLSGQVLQTRQPYVTTDLAADPSRSILKDLSGRRAAACVPLISSQHVLGVLWAGRPAPFTAVEVRVLNAIAGIAASAIQRAGLHEQTEQQLQRMTALRQIDTAIINSLDLGLTLRILLDQAVGQLGVDAGDILLLNQNSLVLEFAAGRGFRTGAIERTRLRLGEGHAGLAALERQVVSVTDFSSSATPFRRAALLAAEAFAAIVCVPLVVKGQVLGVLEVFHRAPFYPNAEWLGFLHSVAGQAAIAVADDRLFNELRQSNLDMRLAYDTTLEGWSAALDLRDKETEGHSQRVTAMTLQLAQALGVSAAEQEHMRRGALLHDIGKMGVPDAILFKPGKLTEEEWAVMHKHPTYAHQLLAPIAFLRPALAIPYCHHEKWDGTGYPRQLQGADIPHSARIFAVIDVWDALSSDRPYRAGWPDAKVQAYLRDQAGKHFDPEVVTAFLELIAASRAS